jgi:hypothetical protein
MIPKHLGPKESRNTPKIPGKYPENTPKISFALLAYSLSLEEIQ